MADSSAPGPCNLWLEHFSWATRQENLILEALEGGMNLPDASHSPGLPLLAFLGLHLKLDPSNRDRAHLLLAGGWVCLSGTSGQGRECVKGLCDPFCWKKGL